MYIYNFDQIFFFMTLVLALLFSFRRNSLGEFLGSHEGIILRVTPPLAAPLEAPGGSMEVSNVHCIP